MRFFSYRFSATDVGEHHPLVIQEILVIIFCLYVIYLTAEGADRFLTNGGIPTLLAPNINHRIDGAFYLLCFSAGLIAIWAAFHICYIYRNSKLPTAVFPPYLCHYSRHGAKLDIETSRVLLGLSDGEVYFHPYHDGDEGSIFVVPDEHVGPVVAGWFSYYSLKAIAGEYRTKLNGCVFLTPIPGKGLAPVYTGEMRSYRGLFRCLASGRSITYLVLNPFAFLVCPLVLGCFPGDPPVAAALFWGTAVLLFLAWIGVIAPWHRRRIIRILRKDPEANSLCHEGAETPNIALR